jgi:hypothetical protein
MQKIYIQMWTPTILTAHFSPETSYGNQGRSIKYYEAKIW